MQAKQLFSHIHKNIFGQEVIDNMQKIDGNANGVQIWSDRDINKIAVGVSCNAEFLEKAIDWGADCCIFHHGMSLKDKYGIYNCRLSPSLQLQLSLALKNDLTIAGYHLSLDMDPNIGNNILIAKHLGLKPTGETYFWEGAGLITEYEQAKNLDDIAKDCSELFHHDVFMIRAKDEIKRVGICSGGAIPRVKDNFELVEKNIDLHITGEVSESISAQAKENGYSYFACGHYATETIGIQALGEKINDDFEDIDVRFIEVWNEL